MNKIELIQALRDANGRLSKQEAGKVVKLFFDEMTKAQRDYLPDFINS